jgi:hypothetical protein
MGFDEAADLIGSGEATHSTKLSALCLFPLQ